jgi:replicative DNA helicase
MGKVIIERPLPQNAEMERTVLGAIIAGHKHRLELIEALRTKDFFDSRHRKLFTTMLAMREAGKETDLLSIDDELRRAGELEDAGGIAYLASIGDSVAKIGDLSIRSNACKSWPVFGRSSTRQKISKSAL